MMLETVKKIVADSLGADMDTLTPETSLCLLKKNLEKKFLQKI